MSLVYNLPRKNQEKKLAIPNDPASIMHPANSTPPSAAIVVFLKSKFKILAAKVPVHAPVPGTGIPMKSNRATYRLRPAFFCNFLPPFSPFFRHHEQNFPIIFLSLPQVKNFRANKKINGTGIMFPRIATKSDGISGKPIATAIGTAPRNSISGTIETRKTNKNFKNILYRF